MADAIRIPWPSELSEVTFASHTVLISEDMLLKEIARALDQYKIFGGKNYLKDTEEWLKGDVEQQNNDDEIDNDHFRKQKSALEVLDEFVNNSK